MNTHLTQNETRVIGSLIEKEITTPDQYPLSLNALTNACNQKSNRDPVLNLDQSTVQETLDELSKKFFVNGKTSYGSRVEKYKHRFCNVGFGALEFTQQEQGIICTMFLRGPQTPGELRTHTHRLCQFSDVQEVEAALDHLMQRNDGPFVVKLPREPGKRESRFAHLFSGEVEIVATETIVEPSQSTNILSESSRIDQLEQEVKALREEIELLKELI
ncbi:MAG: DUF480 domain-containing protein [Candidatus Polarisedimenticolaceae bacterium]|nr:DUF480 domain-containing protein [Candidatus Polarisedimenticolaceae bacterium]